ncbi:MAG: DUF4286 family protein [Planctomycetota bacterium]|jgi:hypothetical protein
MSTFAYTVQCTFDDPAVADEWISWLKSEHLADVRAAGALDAEVIRLDGEEHHVEVRYHFDSREDFELYEREHAPGLREEGLQRFPPERGLQYARSMGDVVAKQ